MKVAYDKQTDTLMFILRENVTIANTEEDKPGVILDYDSGGTSSRSRFSMHRSA